MRTLVCILTFALASTTYAGGTVPFHAAIDTNVAVVGGSPTTLDLVITGTGEGAHVGRLEVDGPSHVDLVGATQTGSSTLVAADGSSFDFSFAGTVVFTGPQPSDPVTFQGTWHVTSGTGRFENASGGGTYHGSATTPTESCSSTARSAILERSSCCVERGDSAQGAIMSPSSVSRYLRNTG